MKPTLQVLAMSLMVMGTQAFAGACLTASGKPSLMQLNTSTDTAPYASGDNLVSIGRPTSGTQPISNASGHCGYMNSSSGNDTDFYNPGGAYLNSTFSILLSTTNTQAARIPKTHFFYGTSTSDRPNPGSKYTTLAALDAGHSCWELDADGLTTDWFTKVCLYL